MRTIVPFDATEPNSRLESLLDTEERRSFAEAMLRDVLSTVRAVGREPEVLSTEPVYVDTRVTVDDRSLTTAINDRIEESDEPVCVIAADVALLTPESLVPLYEAPGEIVLAAGLGGGTNAILSRHPEFRVDYHGLSYSDHVSAARECTERVNEYDSFRLALDIDTAGDLAELLIHGDGLATEWLRDAGFELEAQDTERCRVRRGE